MDIVGNIWRLRKEAREWRYKEINGDENHPYFLISIYQWMILFFSIGLVLYLEKGISQEFAGYTISALSLFVGIFFTFLITLYDKFKSIDFENEYNPNINVLNSAVGKQKVRFFKKVSNLTLYSALIALICICLLALTLLKESLEQRIDFLNVFCVEGLKVWYIIKVIVIFIYRVVLFYYLLDFLLLSLYIISAFYNFLKGEYDEVKIK